MPKAPKEEIKSRKSHDSPASGSPHEDHKNRVGHGEPKDGFDAYSQ